uniref:Putative secreted protein salivary gland overexpressed n=1 Tax=Rhipicephalus microplus TaxID=6941 RepID=A0A6M2DB98_RHIMP
MRFQKCTLALATLVGHALKLPTNLASSEEAFTACGRECSALAQRSHIESDTKTVRTNSISELLDHFIKR